MNNFFYPKSIALLASFNSPESNGCTILQNILNNGYFGRIFTVDPESSTTLGFKNYAFVTEIKSQIDLAIVNYSNKELSYFLNLCGEKGIKNILLFPTRNNKNIKNDNFKKQLAELARKNNLNIIGPNSIGIINNEKKLNISLQSKFSELGQISLFSQGIDFGQIFLNQISGINVNKWINQSSIDLTPQAEIISYLLEDKTTKIVCASLEKIDEPELIASIYHKFRGNKILIVHSSQKINKPILEKNGVIIAKDPKEIMEIAKNLTNQKINLVQNAMLITNYEKILTDFGPTFAKYHLNFSKIIQSKFDGNDIILSSEIKNSDLIILALRPQLPSIDLIPLKNLIEYCQKFSKNILPVFIQNENCQFKKILNQLDILYYDNFVEPLAIIQKINYWVANKNRNKIYIKLFSKQKKENEFSLGI